ncbi:MAG: hypothetical protein J0H98_04355 [Solirubrobacterales bacterium]|nr:hypothetical protein [Solirubrobacterales bacterium]
MAGALKRFEVYSPEIFITLTNWVWHDAPALDSKARAVFLALAGSFNADLKTHIGIDRMADRTGWSRKSVQRGLAKLEDAGVIEVQRRFANSSEITLADEVACSVNLIKRRDSLFGQSDRSKDDKHSHSGQPDRKGDDCSVNLTPPLGQPDLQNTDVCISELNSNNNVNSESAFMSQSDRKGGDSKSSAGSGSVWEDLRRDQVRRAERAKSSESEKPSGGIRRQPGESLLGAKLREMESARPTPGSPFPDSKDEAVEPEGPTLSPFERAKQRLAEEGRSVR